jgi:hypothetical protein
LMPRNERRKRESDVRIGWFEDDASCFSLSMAVGREDNQGIGYVVISPNKNTEEKG